MAERADLTISGGNETSADLPRSAEAIRHDIEAKRAAIATTVDRLGDKVEEAFDWRTYVSEYPLVSLGVAAGLGIFVSRVFKRKPTPGQRVLEALADGVEDATWQLRNGFTEVTGKKNGAGAAVKAAATAWVTKALTDYLKNRVIGAESQDHTTSYPRKQEQRANPKRTTSSDHTISSIV